MDRKLAEHVKTDRLLLRKPRVEDAGDVFAIESDPETNRFRPAGPMKSMEEAIETIKEWRDNWSADGCGYWLVVLPETDEVIGITGIRRIYWRKRDVLNLYYRFSPKAWGKGYAAEAAAFSVKVARKNLPGFPVLARIRPINTPSQKVAEKSGLKRRPDLDTAGHKVFALGWEIDMVNG
ncbi:GNAT family N-acetyltransferase [Sediminibacillus dalangtanensis]|uniref:GNAT family N-acetyltransferase n=1 Tax=Sediminibacillus dalangtanensis TaxID=2729421 RepID=A0ABX7VN52_9BACI|nr:GNAT family N-acetyltransferase [Sediminibacillus dalangtanensis]QTM98267.1 GNAT family N-acetyltransferase [Sediminibacillus dalangtanensis]